MIDQTAQVHGAAKKKTVPPMGSRHSQNPANGRIAEADNRTTPMSRNLTSDLIKPEPWLL